MKTLFGSVAALALALAAGHAGASAIYSNGPYNGTIEGLTISDPYSVADSFYVGTSADAVGVNFVSWNIEEDPPLSVTWTLTSGNPLSGGAFTVLGTGTESVSPVFLETNSQGFQLYSNTFYFPGVSLTGGNYYWLELSGATDTTGDAEYWDQNNGASVAWQEEEGNPGFALANYYTPGSDSETFSILSSVPEPATWTLMLAGFAGLGAALRTRRGHLVAA